MSTAQAERTPDPPWGAADAPAGAGDDRRTADGMIGHLFTTPLARINCPSADELNPRLTEIVLRREAAVENRLVGKSETAADLTQWGEPLVDGITQWVLKMAKQFVESLTGADLDTAYATSPPAGDALFNTTAETAETRVVIAAGHSWASIYRTDDSHEAHFHPNTAL